MNPRRTRMKEDALSLFQEVLELPASAREEIYRRRGVPDALRDEVESLLLFDTESDPLRDAIGATATEVLDNDPNLLGGVVFGPYRLVRKLGQGGMGTVYLADRADGEVEQRVAIKLVRPGAGLAAFRARFLRERSILASLNHPGIARLLDAGRGANGQPYLVMEHIEGVPIDEYCAALDLRGVLNLFLQACDAVAYAHRNLIVHRDLKPSNILVDGAGRLKLLDFGIARILGGSDETKTMVRALTPGYASPEQIRGDAQTTATDIYSLGAVLYRVLTGQTPRLPGDQDATPPSRVKPGIPKDIDCIVSQCLRHNPDDRYPSVNALADDARAFLENRPVRARSGDISYRARKFLRRYWIPVTAAALVALSLGIGIVTANRERAVAQRRFSEVRMLANQLLALDNEIRLLPGSTKARHQLVSVALDYLTRLGEEARGDTKLLYEVGSGYLQVARVQGVPTGANLGQIADAENSLRKADEFMDGVLAVNPRDRAALLQSACIAHDRMILAQTALRDEEASRLAKRAGARLEALASTGKLSEADTESAMQIYANVALAYTNMHNLDDAVLNSRRCVEVANNGSDALSRAGCLSMLANALRFRGDLEEALKTIQQVRAIYEHPPENNQPATLNRIVATWREGRILGEDGGVSLNRPREAIAALQTAFDLSDRLVQSDAADAASRTRLVGAALDLANIVRYSDPRRALELYDYALRRSREVNHVEAKRDQVRLLAGSSYALLRLNRAAESKQRIDAAFDLMKQIGTYPAPTVKPGQEPAVAIRALGEYNASTGRRQEAIAVYQGLLDRMRAAHPTPETDLRDANELSGIERRLSELQRAANMTDAADALDRNRRELWQGWNRKLPNNEFVLRQLASLR